MPLADAYPFRSTALRGALVLIAAIGCAGGAEAACSVSAGSVAFGTYNPSAPDDGTGTVSATCSILDPAPVVGISAGGSGNILDREMSRGSARLNYGIYTDSGRSNVWGDGSSGTSTVTMTSYTSYLLFWRQYSRSIYGRIPAGQHVPAGAYTDNLVVTVTF